MKGIEILENGEPPEIVSPSFPMSRRSAFGALQGKVAEDPDEDLITPLPSEEWEALKP